MKILSLYRKKLRLRKSGLPKITQHISVTENKRRTLLCNTVVATTSWMFTIRQVLYADYIQLIAFIKPRDKPPR